MTYLTPANRQIRNMGTSCVYKYLKYKYKYIYVHAYQHLLSAARGVDMKITQTKYQKNGQVQSQGSSHTHQDAPTTPAVSCSFFATNWLDKMLGKLCQRAHQHFPLNSTWHFVKLMPILMGHNSSVQQA